MLKIERIRLHAGQMPVDLEFSYGSVRKFGFVMAEIHAGGIVGLGEGLAARAEDCAALAQSLIGRDALLLDQLIPAQPEFTWQGVVTREMFSMALHDLAARAAGWPLHVLLGGARRNEIPLMACLFPKSPEQAAETARRFVGQGYRALKVKLFGEAARDAEIIRAVRSELPEGFLQADANCGYKRFEEAADALPLFQDAGLDAIEDPADVPLEEYCWLMEAMPRPKIILDSPTRGHRAIHEAALRRCCDAVNLHPNMQGTFSEIRDRAAILRLSGVDVEIGGTGYTGVGAFAHMHVAAVHGMEYPFGEIGGWQDHGMPASTAAEPLPIRNGMAILPDGPGHGGRLNPETLAKYAQVTEITR